MVRDANPFSTRHTRPGALPFLFSAGHSLEDLLLRFHAFERRGQIVGRHGSGKSTLLEMLVARLKETGFEPESHALHAGQRRLKTTPEQLAQRSPRTILVVDGYEQLRPWTRWRLQRDVQILGAGLLVTTHQSRGLPTLLTTEPSLELAREITRQLTPAQELPEMLEALESAWPKHAGNMRELLFELYDRYENLPTSP